MGDRLTVDTAMVRDTGLRLRTVAAEFDGANAHSDRVADAVGGGSLGDALHDFAHGWDDRRAKMVEQIATLAEMCTAVADGFDGVDAQLASAILGQSTVGPS
ncbi:hypothetical protein [Cellulomonas sp. URHB0016]